MKISYRCRDCEHYNFDCENQGRQRQGGSQICKYFKLKNGVPIEKVFKNIKADIEQIAKDEEKEDSKWSSGLRYSLKIINNHISGKE